MNKYINFTIIIKIFFFYYFKIKKLIKKASKKILLASLAGVLGIEPSLIVLETTVLPIYDTPKYKTYYTLC